MRVIINYDPEGFLDGKMTSVSNLIESYQECNVGSEFLSDMSEKTAMDYIANMWGLEYNELPDLSIFL